MPNLDTEQTSDFSVAFMTERAEKLRDDFGLLSPLDLAALLAVDERTLAAWRAQRRGPDFAKLGRGVFYRREDVIEWIALNTSPTNRLN